MYSDLFIVISPFVT